MTPLLGLDRLVSLPLVVQRPRYEFRQLRIGIVHLGLGAFHRAHQAAYTDDAIGLSGGDWGILSASLHSRAVSVALAAQDHLYTIETLEQVPRYRVVASIRASVHAGTHRVLLQSALSSSRTHIVTLTVTEKGYCLSADGSLDFSHPDISHDLAHPANPCSAIGWLAAALTERHRTHQRPLTIISCDNLKSNGSTLSIAVQSFLEHTSPQALVWVRSGVAFPQTVVDCIVPASTDSSRARVTEAFGMRDLAAVQREPYSQWVIENRFAGPRPSWDSAGVEIVSNVSDYGKLKLHVLNACHSALAYLGLPLGYVFVRDAMADPDLAGFLDELVAAEISPALRSLDVAQYWRTVRIRFSNACVDHRLDQIAVDGAQKLAERVFPLLVTNLQTGAPIQGLARIVRGWLEFSRMPVTAVFDDAAIFPPEMRLSSVARDAISRCA